MGFVFDFLETGLFVAIYLSLIFFLDDILKFLADKGLITYDGELSSIKSYRNVKEFATVTLRGVSLLASASINVSVWLAIASKKLSEFTEKIQRRLENL